MRPVRAARARWDRLDRAERTALLVLAALLAAGALLRLVAMLAYRPALIGYFDTPVYATGARLDLFWDPLRPAGYPFFLRALHGLSDNLSLTTLVQHALGMATALLLYGAVRRGGGPPWLGLIPAAVILLGGDQLLFEHALLSETLYAFLTAAGLYLAVRAIDGSAWAWPAAAGVLLALAATVKLAGLAIVPLAVLWFLLVPAAGTRTRLLRAATAGAGAGAVLLTYLVIAHAQTDEWSFARNGAYHFYGRVATFADCGEFDEPAGTEGLCEETPPHSRSAPPFYIFSGPAVGTFGEPQVGQPSDEGIEKITQFARRAALAQPLGWADASARDFARYVFPGSFRRPNDTATAKEYRDVLVHPERTARNLEQIEGYWSSAGINEKEGLHDALTGYENATALEGAPMAILLLLAALGPALCRGRERRAALLLGGIAVAMLAVPVATVNYEGRLGVPAYGPLAAGAAFGALGAGRLVRARLPSSAG